MRTHFSVLITGQGFSEGVYALRALGLTTAFVSSDQLVSTLRRGSTFDFAADAFLIDGATGNPLRAEGTLHAYKISEAIGGLADMYVMPSGLRWNAAPRVIIGETPGLDASFWSGSNSRIDYLSPYDTFELGRDRHFWQRVYDKLEKQHCAFSPILEDSMASLGVVFAEKRGQVLRHGLRPGVRREALQSEFYAGTHDRYFDAKSAAMQRVLSVLRNRPDATARAIAALAQIAFDPHALEAVPETLAHLHPYFFDIAPHEALAQRTFRLDDQILRFDMLRRETGLAGRPLPEIFEFKRGGHRQQQGWGLAQFEYQAAEQAEVYLAQLRANDDLARKRLHSSFLNAQSRVVGGYARGSDAAVLERSRSRFPRTVIEGWDEVAERNRLRYNIPADCEPESGLAS
jgi:hypothetical protein